MKTYFVYILTNERCTVFYIGVTSDIHKRMQQHDDAAFECFTRRYNLHKLVYLEETNDIRLAIEREKKLKRWKRRWKLELIEKDNPNYVDLSDTL